jgi:probable F420-dependent oxidoreductase
MKIGLIPINIDFDPVEKMINLAQIAESAGVESVWTFEHAIIPMEYESKYPYTADGRMGAVPETAIIDPLIALAAIAGATKTIRLGTGVNILSQVNPLMMAKQAAALDYVSGGRLMLGLGIGWLKEEFDAMGTPFERRGERFDDYVVAMKKVWTGEVVEHKSDFIDWHGFKSYPLPAQKPHLPIIIGGNKGKAFERIAKVGDGWFAPSVFPEELPPYLEQLKAACEAEGRNPDEIEITAMWAMQGGLDTIKQFEDMGVSRLNIPLQVMGQGPVIDNVKRLGDDIIAKL